MNTLAERLKYIRNLRKLSQQEVADLANISQPTYFKIESGITKRTGSILELANVLNVNPTWLATGQGDIYQDNNSILDNKNQLIINYPSATISKKQCLPLNDLLFKQSDDLDNLFTTSIIGDDMNPVLGHLSTVVVDKRKAPLPIVNGMIYAIVYHDRILCRYLRQHLNNTIQIYSELDKQGETLPADEFFNRYQIMGGVIHHIQSHQWQ
ncbi:helix-turn-helix domain-containing protein [Moraxella ovis]|uniref:helix-turn-helix domain-containing protein n=1 Tax=Moraxella ovis TaxID=29433 RepID=UPI000D8147A8|nr:helix-turn-helix domain-containing protein [Moraxella ovis]SPX84349.1 transcriptional repressor DicA [Moraxella ovis]STZ06915.1 transcriptional repressor DicA [Moraxella ovis]